MHRIELLNCHLVGVNNLAAFAAAYVSLGDNSSG